MKQFWILLGALVLTAVAIVAIARKDRVGPSEPSVNVIRRADGLLACIEHEGQRIVILLPAACDNQTSRTTANKATRTFDVDTDFSSSDGKRKVNIQFHSQAPFAIAINNQGFNLAVGRVFYVATKKDPDDDEKISQAPFKPLEPSLEYFGKLKEQLDP